jgi:hypothetical protein
MTIHAYILNRYGFDPFPDAMEELTQLVNDYGELQTRFTMMFAGDENYQLYKQEKEKEKERRKDSLFIKKKKKKKKKKTSKKKNEKEKEREKTLKTPTKKKKKKSSKKLL